MTMTRILQCVLVLFALLIVGCQGNDLVAKEAAKTTPEKKEHQGKPPENANKKLLGEGNQTAPTDGNVGIEANAQTQKGSDPALKGTEPTQKESTHTSIVTLPSSFMDWVILILVAAGCIVMVVVIGMGLLQLRKQSWQHLETRLGRATADQISATRDAQKEVLDKLSSLSSAQKDTGTRLHDMHTEIRSLARLVRESAHSRGDGHSSYSSLASSFAQSEPLPPDEPDFPVSVFDYLGKMTRFTNVVKRDFQNNILISDPDGTGELVLIRDSRVPDETQPLFVVPRHGQFQTKQDFHTYYEKYYDCHRPQAGDVWIIDPAVVEKVSGGWQLREKGLLEIRS